MENHPLRNVGFWAHQIMTAFHSEANKALQEFGISISEAIPLKILHYHGSESLVEIAKRLNFSHPSVLRHIDSLEKLGLVVRTPHQEDRRVKIVKLTDKGRKLTPKIMDKLRLIHDTATSGISEQEFNMLLKMLSKIHRNLAGDACLPLEEMEKFQP